jgi:Bacterial Ig-like domain (group 1)
MPVPVRMLMAIFLCLLAFAHLPGCGSAGGGEGSSSNDSQDLNLSLSTTTGATSIPADGTSSVTLQMAVTRASGEGVENTPVVFSSNAGTLTAAAAAVAATNSDQALLGSISRQLAQNGPVTVNTDANGVAQAILTSSTNVEMATVVAEVMDFRQSIQINFISGIPEQLELTAQPATVGTDQTSTIQATVTDAEGAPLEQINVAFALITNNSGASLSTATALTDSNGQASVTYTPGATAGTDTVQATISDDITATVDVSVQQVTTAADSLDLLVSSPQLDSDGSEMVTLTALVRDANNNFLADIPVTFSADSGGVQVVNGATDAAGAATAQLSTAGDPTNRTITVTATSGGLTSTNNVEVSGTTVAISGVNSLVLGGTTTLSILLQDSGGNGIANQAVAVTSNQDNTLSAETVTTDSNGQATIDVTADSPINDTITASALGASGATILIVNSADFSFITPDPTAPADQREIDLRTSLTITIRWLNAGVPQVGETINFFATRGTLTATRDDTDANGEASVEISSTTAGPAVITAEADMDDGPSSQVAVEFVATSPNSLILQATPTTLGVNPAGSTNQQSIITAVVRDAANNLVKNQRVSFTLTDNTGGSIFPAAATTDSFGRASTVYTAGATPSAQDGVIVNAVVAETIGDEVRLTVAQQALFVKLGTSNLIQLLSDTQYAKPYSVLVTDANSNPVAGARVELNILPIRYQKGSYVPTVDENDACTGWSKNPTAVCLNEDQDSKNGILDPGEDFNGNGILDPGNIATVPTTVNTNATGFAFFDVVYAREFTWVEVQLEARATVAGSEASSTATFFLPGVASDFDDCDVSPPGQESPYGQAITCSCDELTDPTCPTF